MPTAYALLLQRCGLSHSEAAAWHGVRLDTVKSWSAGRNRAPAGVIADLRSLYARIERAADEALAALRAVPQVPNLLELGLASDDEEARQLGLPCAGAHAALLGIVAARCGLPVRIVPRGSTPAAAAAAERAGR